jgi:hypothetical protein
MDDGQVAELLDYVRNSWGNSGAPVAVDEVGPGPSIFISDSISFSSGTRTSGKVSSDDCPLTDTAFVKVAISSFCHLTI